jgi:hypothetical protein
MQAPACKGGLQCLGQVLAAVEPAAWTTASVGFQLLLLFVTDARPKIRKRATASVTELLAGVQSCPASLTAASESVLACECSVLLGPVWRYCWFSLAAIFRLVTCSWLAWCIACSQHCQNHCRTSRGSNQQTQHPAGPQCACSKPRPQQLVMHLVASQTNC